jgi:hypothetical protein
MLLTSESLEDRCILKELESQGVGLIHLWQLFRFRLGVMVKCQTPVETLMDLHIHSVGYPISIHGHLL